VIQAGTLAYVAPFAVFMFFVALRGYWDLTDLADQLVRITAVSAAIVVFSRKVLDFRVRAWGMSIVWGVVISAVWVLPDLLLPSYRHSIFFENRFFGSATSTLAGASLASPLVLMLRSLRAILIVPIVEELFWRGWLQRWLIDSHFQKVPYGTYSAFSFWTTAVLFASEHGPYWDVGLAAGCIFNFWMLRVRGLADLIVTHAVANACLSAYVIAAGKWEYWL
jgi:CAAX prenyl protease-like protein